MASIIVQAEIVDDGSAVITNGDGRMIRMDPLSFTVLHPEGKRLLPREIEQAAQLIMEGPTATSLTEQGAAGGILAEWILEGASGRKSPGELFEWWMRTAESDIQRMAPKVAEYTASDLVLMGQFLAEWTGLPTGSGPEAACAFYLLGKIARTVAAYKEGRLPSEDTLHDIVAYGMMMRRIREVGGWPS